MVTAKRVFFRMFIAALASVLAVVWYVNGFEHGYRWAKSHYAAWLGKKINNDIVIGVVWPEGEDGFVEGAQLAVEQINDKGGLLQRKLRLQIENETAYLQESRVDLSHLGRYRNASQEAANRMARKLVANENLVAVIGHSDASDTAVPAAITYQQNNVLFLASAESNVLLTQVASPLLFQMQPSTLLLAQQLIRYCVEHDYYDIVILNARGSGSEEVSAFIQKMAGEMGLKVVTNISYQKNMQKETSESQYSHVISSLLDIRESHYNAILFIGDATAGQEIIRMGRKVGVSQPFIATEALDHPRFTDHVGTAGLGTVIASVSDDTTYQGKKFARNFSRYYHGKSPGKWAGTGYDSIQLLALLMNCANSINPLSLAHALRFQTPILYGVSGVYGFNENGSNDRKQFTFKQLEAKYGNIMEFVPMANYY